MTTRHKKLIIENIKIGYKGIGMCKNCVFSIIKPGVPMLCEYYSAHCRSVCRNCPGIRHLKTILNASQ